MTRIRKVYISLVLLIVLITVVCLIIINQFGTFNFENSQMVSKLVSNTHAKYDYTGQNIKIAVIDSGIMDTHSDFGENIKVGYNFILDTTDTFDFNGHGTHVSGVIAAQDNEIGIKGIAPKAEIYPLLVLNEEGKGEISDVCEAISWCINNKIDIINLSFSTKKMILT